MSGPVQAALAIAVLAAVADWIVVARGGGTAHRITRPAVIASLIAAALLADPAPSTATLMLVAALAASMAGDWLLLPPVRFTAGLVAFLVAQLAYLALFLLGHLDTGLALVGIGTSVVLLLVVGRPILAGAARTGMVGPVTVYLVAICLMAIAATASGSLLAAAGAWLFVLSDAGLGSDRFAAPPAVTRAAVARRRLAIIVTYHAAQVLLTLAVLGSAA